MVSPFYCSVAVILCLAATAAGSCLSYGHSCWGAHGKRNGAGSSSSSSEDAQWFLSRLAPPPAVPPEWLPQRSIDIRTSSSVDEDDPESPMQEDAAIHEEPEIIVMERPTRLYKLLNRNNDKRHYKTSLRE
uniref:CCHamide-1 n=1 Tax=Laodelphax striatellus TaxID=195883 RepID=A0A345BED6_LAOST|nr:CCHamide-1 [Laodelphax striatellus]